jgi:hypothetical protein
MLQKLKKITPEWMQIHLPPVLITIIGIITGSIILTNQYINQAKNQFLSTIEQAYSSDTFAIDGDLLINTKTETTSYPIKANIQYKEDSYPILDLPTQTVTNTPFGSFQSVRMYKERTFGKLTEVDEYWISVNTPEFISFSYQNFLDDYIPNIFDAPHEEFWVQTFSSRNQALSFFEKQITEEGLIAKKEADSLIVNINQKKFRDISIDFYQQKNNTSITLEERNTINACILMNDLFFKSDVYRTVCFKCE